MIDYDSHAQAPSGETGVWIYRLTIGVGILLILGMSVGSAFLMMYARTQAAMTICRANLSQLGHRMGAFRAEFGHLPPAHVVAPNGNRLHSWRILVTKYVDPDFSSVSYDFGEPWDSAKNEQVRDRRPNFFACPSDPVTQTHQRLTNYFVVTGSNTSFPDSGTTAGPKGSSNTILMVEASNLSIEWLEPRDLEFDGMGLVPNDARRPSISSHHSAGPFVVMADGSTRSIKGIAPEVLRAMLQYRPDADDD